MRGVVLLGILIMNINGMGLAGAYGDPTVSGGATGWNLTTWIQTYDRWYCYFCHKYS